MKRVVITGIGAVTPLGNNIEFTWKNLTKKISGIGSITRFDSSGLPSRIAGELKKFSPEDYISQKDILRLDPFIHYATAAAIMAVEDAGIISRHSSLVTHHSSLDSAGVFIGSSRGGIISMEKALEKYLLKGRLFSAYLMSSSTINMAPSYISMRLGIKGPVIGISTACASGTNAIGEATRLIRYGEIDLALAGGAEAPVCKLAVGGYGTAGALSKRNDEPEKASRPFDKDRDGFVIAEGAGIVVLEEHEHALKRGARIYAELAGYGTSSDAFHQTKPDSKGEAIAIKKSLNDAKISADDVDHINAHATSTVLGDIAETQAIKEVFEGRAYDIPISSCKSMLGHMLGGAGAVEAAITAMSINKEEIIPTINLKNPAPDCNLNHVTSVTNKKINIALSNSFGFGGVNAVLVLRKFNG
jgi:3-oxoacyl-[acyl-carrier-protein] synthase II